MSYRTHRFSYGNALRETQTFHVLTPGSDATTPSSRLYDGLDDRVWRASTSGAVVINVDAVNGRPFRGPVRRFVVPASHNVADISASLRLQQSPTDSVYTDIALATGETLRFVPAKGEPMILDLADSIDRYLALSSSAGTAALELGEIEWLLQWSPATGEVPDWDHPLPDDNATISKTQSGASFTTINGPATRRFEVTHQGVQASDLRGYEELGRAVGQSQRFWYDHSDSGDWRTLVAATDDAGQWSPTNATHALATGPDGASSAIELTNTATLAGSCSRTLAAAQDLRDCVFSIDVYAADAAEVGASFSLYIQLVSALGGSTLFDVGRAINQSALSATWFRVYFAPETIPSFTVNSPVDLSRVDTVIVNYDPPGSGAEVIRFANFQAWRRSKRPRHVRFRSTPQKRQESRVPSSSIGPIYRVQLEMEETIG